MVFVTMPEPIVTTPPPVITAPPLGTQVVDTTIVDPAAVKKVEPVVPAKLEVKLEGVSATDLAAFTAVATEAGLDSVKAQKIADLYASMQTNAKNSAEAAFKVREDSWLKTLKADKDFGGLNGVDLEKNKAIAVAALKKSNPELQAVLHETGLGSHPAIVKHFFALGKSELEDTIAGSKNSQSTKPSDEDTLRKMYPSMYK